MSKNSGYVLIFLGILLIAMTVHGMPGVRFSALYITEAPIQFDKEVGNYYVVRAEPSTGDSFVVSVGHAAEELGSKAAQDYKIEFHLIKSEWIAKLIKEDVYIGKPGEKLYISLLHKNAQCIPVIGCSPEKAGWYFSTTPTYQQYPELTLAHRIDVDRMTIPVWKVDQWRANVVYRIVVKDQNGKEIASRTMSLVGGEGQTQSLEFAGAKIRLQDIAINTKGRDALVTDLVLLDSGDKLNVPGSINYAQPYSKLGNPTQEKWISPDELWQQQILSTSFPVVAYSLAPYAGGYSSVLKLPTMQVIKQNEGNREFYPFEKTYLSNIDWRVFWGNPSSSGYGTVVKVEEKYNDGRLIRYKNSQLKDKLWNFDLGAPATPTIKDILRYYPNMPMFDFAKRGYSGVYVDYATKTLHAELPADDFAPVVNLYLSKDLFVIKKVIPSIATGGKITSLTTDKSTLTEGEWFKVAIKVKNTGDRSQNYKIRLGSDGAITFANDELNVFLNPNQETTVYSLAQAVKATSSAKIYAWLDGLDGRLDSYSTTVSVKEAQTPYVAPSPSSTPSPSGGATPSPTPAVEKYGNLRVAVVDKNGGGLPNVEVTVQGQDNGFVEKKRTDSSGLVTFPSLRYGSYTVVAYDPDHGTASDTIQIDSPDNVLTLKITKTGVTEYLMEMNSGLPNFVWIIAGVLLIAGGVYIIRKR